MAVKSIALGNALNCHQSVAVPDVKPGTAVTEDLFKSGMHWLLP